MKKSILLFLFVMSNVLLSCNKEEVDYNDYGGCQYVDPHFRVQSLSSRNLDKYSGSYHSRGLELEPFDTIQQSHYLIDVLFDVEYYAKKSKASTGMLYALTCLEPGYKGSKDGIENVSVLTLEDLSAEYRANDTIKDGIWFDGYRMDYTTTEFINAHKTAIMEDYFSLSIFTDLQDSIQKCQFKIILELTNGDVFETITDPVFLED